MAMTLATAEQAIRKDEKATMMISGAIDGQRLLNRHLTHIHFRPASVPFPFQTSFSPPYTTSLVALSFDFFFGSCSFLSIVFVKWWLNGWQRKAQITAIAPKAILV